MSKASKDKTSKKLLTGLAEFGSAPRVALLGRPNVGKSTLFNRLIRSNRAITHDLPGITRDRMEGWVKRKGRPVFIIVDTGGITLDAHAASVEGPAGIRGFEEEILQQARQAIAEADVLCLVVDAKDGLTPFDTHLADFLRRSGKPLLLVVNKVDGPEHADLLTAEFHGLGFGLIACSAEHGFNINLLTDKFYDFISELEQSFQGAAAPVSLEKEQKLGGGTVSDAPVEHSGTATDITEGAEQVDEKEEQVLRLALLGRPNVGKSSLVNALCGTERMIVSPLAGTTRDSIDVTAMINGQLCIFVDSAGVRRRSKIQGSVERFSVNSSLKTSSKADVTLLVLDGQEGLTQQDKRLLELLDERKLPFIVMVNKADLIPNKDLKAVEQTYRKALAYCPHIPFLMVSAHNRKNLNKILPLALSILAESQTRAATGQLNRMLESLLQNRQPPIINARRAKFYYMTQAESTPPTFVFFVSDKERVPEAYTRYLERAMRKMLGLKHAPIRLHIRQAK